VRHKNERTLLYSLDAKPLRFTPSVFFDFDVDFVVGFLVLAFERVSLANLAFRFL